MTFATLKDSVCHTVLQTKIDRNLTYRMPSNHYGQAGRETEPGSKSYSLFALASNCQCIFPVSLFHISESIWFTQMLQSKWGTYSYFSCRSSELYLEGVQYRFIKHRWKLSSCKRSTDQDVPGLWYKRMTYKLNWKCDVGFHKKNTRKRVNQRIA